MTRSVFVSFCLLVGVVVLVLGDIDPNQPDRPGIAVPIVIAVSLICLAFQRMLPRPLDCTAPTTLAATYRTRFFLRIAFAEACSLTAFTLYIALGPGWVYAVGLAFTLIGYTVAATTRAHLRADQDALSLNGRTLSLVAALRTPAVDESGPPKIQMKQCQHHQTSSSLVPKRAQPSDSKSVQNCLDRSAAPLRYANRAERALEIAGALTFAG